MRTERIPSGRMNEGLLLVLVLLAFVVLAVFVISRTDVDEKYYPAMSTYSPTDDGAKALYDLMVRQGIAPVRHGDTEYEYPEQSCMVVLREPEISLSSMVSGMLDDHALLLWIREGGSLVLVSDPLMELDTTTFSSVIEAAEAEQGGDSGNDAGTYPAYWEYLSQDVMAQRAGSGQEGKTSATWRVFQPGVRYSLPSDRPPLWRDVETIETSEASFINAVDAQVLLSTGDPPEPVVLCRRIGEGEIYWVTRPELFSNAWIDREDNHRLVLALLSTAAGGRPIYFDEHIHGFAREHHNPLSLLLKTRGGQLLIMLAFAVLIIFLGYAVRAARVKPQPVPQRRQALEMVLAQADLYRRAGIRDGIAKRLINILKRRYMQKFHFATVPTDAMLLAGLRQESAIDTDRHWQLVVYLETGVLPRLDDGRSLIKLARTCDDVIERLESARIR